MSNNYVHSIGGEDPVKISEISEVIYLVFDEYPELKDLVRKELPDPDVNIHSWEGIKQ